LCILYFEPLKQVKSRDPTAVNLLMPADINAKLLSAMFMAPIALISGDETSFI